MGGSPKEPRLERRRLADLLAYPSQEEFFEDLPDHDLAELARALREGHVAPIHILPDKNKAGFQAGTILDGHMRRKAHELNGTAEVEVFVRYDLAEADLAVIERDFLAANQHRRHQSPLKKARVALRLFELAKGRRTRLSDQEEAEARDLVGREIGMSGRNLQRYWNVLHTPAEVQDAVSARRLRLTDAERVARLGDTDKSAIAARICGGEDPKDVVASFVSGNGRRSAGDPVTFLVRGLARAFRHVEGRIDELPRHRLRISLPHLREAQQVIASLIARALPAEDRRNDASNMADVS